MYWPPTFADTPTRRSLFFRSIGGFGANHRSPEAKISFIKMSGKMNFRSCYIHVWWSQSRLPQNPSWSLTHYKPSYIFKTSLILTPPPSALYMVRYYASHPAKLLPNSRLLIEKRGRKVALRIAGWLKDWEAKGLRVNIVDTDFVNLGGLVDTALQLNANRKRSFKI